MRNEPGLPRAVDQLTAEWLTQALQSSCPGVVVDRIETEHIIWGTATKVLVDVRYAGDVHPVDLPAKLCIKGEFDERSRSALNGMAVTGTQVEASFFNDLAPRLGFPLPRHWYGGSEPGMGILVLDNLAAQGYRFGMPSQAWPVARVAQALEILAALHASTWGNRYAELKWLEVGSSAVRSAAETLMSTAHWERHFTRPEVYKMPRALADNERVMKAYRALWQYDDARAHCVVHGDAHMGNTCIDPSGKPFFIDWAGPCYSHWGLDVPYFVIGALSLEDRRSSERELFSHYLDKLAEHGGPRLDPELAWDEYRQHVVHGMMWATLPPELQAAEYVHAMGERFSAAMIEHDTLNRLGV